MTVTAPVLGQYPSADDDGIDDEGSFGTRLPECSA